MGIHSVSEVNRFIKTLLDRETILHHIMVRGELSNFKQYPSGHCYFALKDAGGVIKCVMFRSRAQTLRFQPVNGLKVVASGTISVYERDGVYQLYVDSLQPEGTGDLALAFEQLKTRLTNEGLFDASKKKSLPRFPKRIGVVTSLAGAVLRDIYRVSKRRWPSVQLILYPVQVQGEGSAAQIAHAIQLFNQKALVDVLIVGRGGGSMEDLWSFNEEIVVRAIASSKIPVISAVGHETDFTLADFAADVRAATPSQAAELSVPDRQELRRFTEGLIRRLQTQAGKGLEKRRLYLEALWQRPVMKDPQNLLSSRRQRLDQACEKLTRVVSDQLMQRRHRLELSLKKLDMLNPAHVLQRGYAAVEKNGVLLTSVRQAAAGDRLMLTFQDGARVVEVIDETEAEKKIRRRR